MKMPEKWSGDYLARLIQGVAAGAVATMVIGFGWGGWTLGSTAEKMAADRTEKAVVAAMAPVCADLFVRTASTEQKAEYASKDDNWGRGTIVESVLKKVAGTDMTYGLKNACAEAIGALKKPGPEKQATKG